MQQTGTCPICLIPYSEHLGMTGTCSALKEAKKDFRRFVFELLDDEIITQSRACEALRAKAQDLRGWYILYKNEQRG